MDTVLKKGDITILEDKERYVVVEIFKYKNIPYLYLVKSSTIEKDETPVIFFATEVITGEELSLEIVTDKDLAYELAKELKMII